MSLDINGVRSILERHDRTGLIEIISGGAALPGVVKAAAYVYIQSMDAARFNEVCSKGLEAVGYIQTGDIDGLKSFSEKNGVPAEIINLISVYGKKI